MGFFPNSPVRGEGEGRGREENERREGGRGESGEQREDSDSLVGCGPCSLSGKGEDSGSIANTAYQTHMGILTT